MHLALMPEITVHDADNAEGLWYMVDWAVNLATNRETQGAAFYRDRYVRRHGEWQILHSGYVRAFEKIEFRKEPIDLHSHLFAKFGPPREGGSLPK